MGVVHGVMVPLVTTFVHLRTQTLENSAIARNKIGYRYRVFDTQGIAHEVCDVAHVEDIFEIRFLPLLDVTPCLVDTECGESGDEGEHDGICNGQTTAFLLDVVVVCFDLGAACDGLVKPVSRWDEGCECELGECDRLSLFDRGLV
jgi:hypothetical protein